MYLTFTVFRRGVVVDKLSLDDSSFERNSMDTRLRVRIFASRRDNQAPACNALSLAFASREGELNITGISTYCLYRYSQEHRLFKLRNRVSSIYNY